MGSRTLHVDGNHMKERHEFLADFNEDWSLSFRKAVLNDGQNAGYIVVCPNCSERLVYSMVDLEKWVRKRWGERNADHEEMVKVFSYIVAELQYTNIGTVFWDADLDEMVCFHCKVRHG